MVLHYAIREGETIQYCDVMSQYPFVCKYFKFRIGHPKIHVGDACRAKQAMLSKEGLIKCTVLPPKRLSSGPAIPLQLQIVILSMWDVRITM